MNKFIQFSLVTIVFSLILIGCGNSKILDKKKKDNILTYSTVKDIGDMNPHVYGGSMFAEDMIYESLVENTEDGIKPLLAKSWDISKDGKIYTFHLREDVKFHDGTEFDAEAVKKNIEAVQSNKELHSWIRISTLIQEIEVIDKYTVGIKLSEVYQPALYELAMPRPFVFISPRDFKNGTTKNGVKAFDGTGPFEMGEHKKGESAEFIANETYWRGRSKLDKVEVKVIPDGETTFLAMQKGEINFVFTDDRGTDSLDESSIKQLTDKGEHKVYHSEPMSTKMIVANSGKKDSPISDKSVRQAIAYAVDRKKISKDILNGQEKPANQLFAKNVTDINFDIPTRQYDLDKANQLLDKDGWKEKDKNNIRKKDGKILKLFIYYENSSSNQKGEAEFLQSEFKKVGIILDLNGETSDKIAKRRSSGDYDLLFNQTWGLLYDPQSTVAGFKSKNAYGTATEGIEAKDSLYENIDEAFQIQDDKKRSEKYKEILTQLEDEAIFIPLTFGGMTVIAPKNLEGIRFTQSQYELPFNEMYYK